MNSVAELNIALSAALGIKDSSRCSEVTLKIVAGQLPRVQATFWVDDAAGLAQVVQDHVITPQPQAEVADGGHAA
jgi:hypothetical protein